MSTPDTTLPTTADTMPDDDAAQPDSGFGDILSEFEQSHHSRGETVEGTVVSVTPDAVIVDIGRKMEGTLPPDPKVEWKAGLKVLVTVRGRDEGGYYQLSTIKVEVPKDWSGLEAAFASKSTISGTVVEAVKGGLRVDVGVRAFMPASRSGVREVADLEKLIGQQIECRIIKLDTTEEDVVVDRRVVLEEAERHAKEQAFSRLQEGMVVQGAVRSLTDFGAFVDLGGVDGLLHVSDMSYARNIKPADVVKPGDSIQVKILKISPEKRKISLGMKQLMADPWSVVAEKLEVGTKIRGKVTRVTDFGAFVELEPGIEGLIHVSEMSWAKKSVRAADIVKPEEVVEVVVLGVNTQEKRIALGLKQALGDPWEDALKKYPVGAVVEAPVTNMAKFGAFVDIGGGVEGMIHIGDISAEKRLNHPNEALKQGEVVKAVVLEADRERRRMRLGIKQLQPTSIDEYLAEHKTGEVVTGRVTDVSGSRIKVELGEGVTASAKLPEPQGAGTKAQGPEKADLGSLTAMLAQKWKTGGSSASEGSGGGVRAGEIRSFKIITLDAEKKKIELELQ